jgi:pyrroline-5-carboxylate reductase
MRITFIGGGNMTTSLVGGLLAKGFDRSMLSVAEPIHEQRKRLRERFAVAVHADNALAVTDADAIVLAVKPQQLADVARQLAAALGARRALVISIAAGIRLADLERWLGAGCALVRAMPNRPALIGAGVAALFARETVTPPERDAAEAILRAGGATVWLAEESQMDAVTAISGSGPAYFFLLTEALEQAGLAFGLPAETARLLAVETARGAGCMVAQGPESPARLREQVTSAGGTTAAALAVLDQADVRGIFARAIKAAAERSMQLADEYR